MTTRPCMTRRQWLASAGVAVGAGAVAAGGRLVWHREESFQRATTFVGHAEAYDGRLVDLIKRGLREIGFGPAQVRGRTVLLKPNLVEPISSSPHVNTHPVFVRAVAEVFRSMGAREVATGEGPGHIRDTRLVLDESGMDAVLREARLPFHDLNLDEVFEVNNTNGYSKLATFQLPATLRRFNLLVSLPKLKTHHWAGVTLSLKNLFGVMPGIVYGWPKNTLHVAGLTPVILDIAAAVRPALAIVDGVVGMEGDGPIMGQARAAGVVVMGTNLLAVDATATRLMGIDPGRVDYLAVAAGRFGPIREEHIRQRGELLSSRRHRFKLVAHQREAGSAE